MRMRVILNGVELKPKRKAEVDEPLPGFEAAIAEGEAAVAADKQLELSGILASPKASIESKAGAMEMHSPLFRGHGPQGELF